jgi:hypothetical protein
MNPLGIVTQRTDYQVIAKCIDLLWTYREKYPVTIDLVKCTYIDLLFTLEKAIKEHVTVEERERVIQELEAGNFIQAKYFLRKLGLLIGDHDSIVRSLGATLRWKEFNSDRESKRAR